MKTVLFILVLIISSCEDTNDLQIGCMTGMHGGYRELIWCCTYEQYLAGTNVGAGGNARAQYYTDWRWEQCDKCQMIASF